jgi:hypothetical protein
LIYIADNTRRHGGTITFSRFDMTSKTKKNFVALAQAFVEVVSSGPYFDRWYSDEQVLAIIGASYDISEYITPGLEVAKSLTLLNRCIYKSPFLNGIDTKSGSEGGIYRMKFSIINEEKARKERYFYAIASNKFCPPFPLTQSGAQTVYDKKVRTSRKRIRCENDEILFNADENNPSSISNIATINEASTLGNNGDHTTNNQSATMYTTPSTFMETATSTTLETATTKTNDNTSTSSSMNIYWESKNARDLFCPNEEEMTILAVHRLITTTEEMADISRDTVNSIKYMLLRRAYVFALELMSKCTWKKCCIKALQSFHLSGFKIIKDAQTIMKWHRHFRVNGTLLPDRSKQTKEVEPKLFSVYPEAKAAVNRYFSKNLESVNVDQFRSYLLDEVLPKIILDTNLNTNEPPLDLAELLSSIGLRTLGLATAYKYLRHLGYIYSQSKKCYYNDGHEKPEQISYRRTFIVEYFASELLCYVWIQITEEAAKMLESKRDNNALLKDIGYTYMNDDGVQMREYHVDCHASFQLLITNSNQPYGGNLSVRRDPIKRPCICIGEDESSFSQYTFASKSWKGPNGEEKLKPKGEGETIMVAAFCSRTFGLGRKLSSEELFLINKYRDEYRPSYLASSEAVEINGTTTKTQIVNNSPFLRYFEVGAEKEGFWNYMHMALMTEDLVDCLQVIYPNHDLLIYFDQSSGHCRKRVDGLNVVGMNADWGGVQKIMRDTVIVEGCLGPFHSTLAIGEVQRLVFVASDLGPYYRRKGGCTKEDVVVGKRKKRNAKQNC